VLLVPAVVNAQTPYREAWSRSQAQIRKLLPLAEDLKIVVAIEEVWNKFLLSPLEMARISKNSEPMDSSVVDVGNVVLYGYPQDWIERWGRASSSSFEGLQAQERRIRVVNLGDGDVDWEAVRGAFREIGYAGAPLRA